MRVSRGMGAVRKGKLSRVAKAKRMPKPPKAVKRAKLPASVRDLAPPTSGLGALMGGGGGAPAPPMMPGMPGMKKGGKVRRR